MPILSLFSSLLEQKRGSLILLFLQILFPFFLILMRQLGKPCLLGFYSLLLPCIYLSRYTVLMNFCFGEGGDVRSAPSCFVVTILMRQL